MTPPLQLRYDQTPYGCVIADPPWRYDNTASRGAAEDHYPTMSVVEIAALPVESIVANNAHLYLWVTDSHLPDVFKWHLFEAWGFRYVKKIAWLKVKDGKPQMGMGNYIRNASELCLFGVRGKAPARAHDVIDFFWAPRGEHSAKPSNIHEIAEKISTGPYLEMFARTGRHGWDAWGNEAPAAVVPRPIEAGKCLVNWKYRIDQNLVGVFTGTSLDFSFFVITKPDGQPETVRMPSTQLVLPE